MSTKNLFPLLLPALKSAYTIGINDFAFDTFRAMAAAVTGSTFSVFPLLQEVRNNWRTSRRACPRRYSTAL